MMAVLDDSELHSHQSLEYPDSTWAAMSQESAMNSLCLLHLSDLHCTAETLDELAIRRDSLIADLKKLGASPDLVMITGDIAFAGDAAQFAAAADTFIVPLTEAFGIDIERVLICPGNHDIARGAVSRVVADGIRARLKDSESAKTLLGDSSVLPLEETYLRFLSELYGRDVETAHWSRTFTLHGVRVGVASFDSAWLCLDDQTRGHLFLTRGQVGPLRAAVAGCDLRIAMMHHPLEWFHSSEQGIVQNDLLNGFDVVVCGHEHASDSQETRRPDGSCIQLVASSGLAEVPEGAPDGYAVYTIDLLKRGLDAQFRKFIRGGRRYDRNVDHAPDGEASYSLPSSARLDAGRIAIAQRASTKREELAVRSVEALKKAQQVDVPVVLDPVLKSISWSSAGKQEEVLADAFSFAMCQERVLLFAPPDVGSTTFLLQLGERIALSGDETPLLVNAADLNWSAPNERLMKKALQQAGLKGADLENGNYALIVDDVQSSELSEVQRVLGLSDVVSRVIACVRNEVVFDSLLQSSDASGSITFAKLDYWGPRRLRQFVDQYFEAAGHEGDSDAAYRFIRQSLALSDLPVTPLLVALYMRIFCHDVGGEVNPVSFVRLLDKLQDWSLDQADPEGSYSIYNLQLVLRNIAVYCYRAHAYGIPRAELAESVSSFFENAALEVDVDHFIDHLLCSGIVLSGMDETIGFSCMAFFWYYLADALEHGDIDLGSQLGSLSSALRMGDALAYYAFNHRDNEAIADAILQLIDSEYPSNSDITSEDLRRYVNHLLMPPGDGGSGDEVARTALDSTVDYDEEDKDFGDSQKMVRETGRGRLMGDDEPDDLVDRVSRNMDALKLLYNVFRMLEHISAEAKLRILDRILSFHLQCNMDFIALLADTVEDEQFSSLWAYLVTLAGQGFLSSNVGAASLKRTIDALRAETDNKLKEFLLLSIYADLGLQDYAVELEMFVLGIEDDLPLTEMTYAKIHQLLVEYERPRHPAALLSAFNAAFTQRASYEGNIHPIALQKMRDETLESIRRQHFQWLGASDV